MDNKISRLVLVRHGQSRWNALGFWTGWTDIALSPKGHEEAKRAGQALKDIHFDLSFVSDLDRAEQTLEDIFQSLDYKTPVITNQALRERDYGDLTGKNKWELKLKYGNKQFDRWRRSWDYPVPGGESLKDVYGRVVPYYLSKIQPELEKGKNVLVSAHGNSLRALVKYLEKVSDDEIPLLEIKTGEILIYKIDTEGKIVSKERRLSETPKSIKHLPHSVIKKLIGVQQ